MKKCIPDRKWRLLCDAVDKGVPPRLPELVPIYEVKIGKASDEQIEYALSLLDTEYHRDVLTAYFLSGASIAQTGESLYIDDDGVLELFQWLYVNPDEFRNKLDIIGYSRVYSETVATPEGRDLICMGVQMGPHALVNHMRYGNDPIEIDMKKLTSEMAAQAYHLGMLARANPITSKVSQQAAKWTSQFMSMLPVIDKLKDAANEMADLHIEIEKRRVTRTAEEANLLPEGILH